MSRLKETHSEKSRDKVNDRFVEVATVLGQRFPDLDLRFARETEEDYFIMQAVGVSDEIFEFELSGEDMVEIINEAILSLKVLTREFDD